MPIRRTGPGDQFTLPRPALNRLRGAVRYEHEAAGDLIHVDIKKLGRIPWRRLADARPRQRRRPRISMRTGPARQLRKRHWAGSAYVSRSGARALVLKTRRPGASSRHQPRCGPSANRIARQLCLR
ncbi:hypothetical protein EJK15_22730 [Nonomuraea basaltis]|nr:hypothetical protein EJK15_22730 [Nonomuraea basaltis]